MVIKKLISEEHKIIHDILKLETVSPTVKDIDKYPAVVIDILSSVHKMISKTQFKYNILVAINYYPDLENFDLVEYLEVYEKFSDVFQFDVGDYKVMSCNVVNNDDFITVTCEYEITIITNKEKQLGMLDVEYENIENIDMKEDLVNERGTNDK